jgi:hypothetical protein
LIEPTGRKRSKASDRFQAHQLGNFPSPEASNQLGKFPQLVVNPTNTTRRENSAITRQGESMNPKFFYIEDDTAMLFASNGTALAALLIGIPDILPLLDFPVPTYPMWLFFAGLFLAFGAKSVIQLQNEDTRQREKLQHARDWIMNTDANPDVDGDVKTQLPALWERLDARHKRLLSERQGRALDHVRAACYLLSGTCFLAGTGSLIYLAGFAKAAT